jgi:hypothetical protein
VLRSAWNEVSRPADAPSAAGPWSLAFNRLEQFRSPLILAHGRGTAISWSWRGLFPVNESVHYDIQENQNERLVECDSVLQKEEAGQDHPGAPPAPHLYGGSDFGEFGHLRVPIEASIDFDPILADRYATA